MVANYVMTHLQRIGRTDEPSGRTLTTVLGVGLLTVALSTVACAPPDPKALLRASDVETYWVLDPSRTAKRFLAPAVRFKVENVSQERLLAVDATAAFYREGVAEPWGSGFFRLTERSGEVGPGATVMVTMSSDARYTLEGEPETVFSNPGFKSVKVKFFLKVGNSEWAPFGEASVENVIGSKDAREVIEHQEQEPVPPGIQESAQRAK